MDVAVTSNGLSYSTFDARDLFELTVSCKDSNSCNYLTLGVENTEGSRINCEGGNSCDGSSFEFDNRSLSSELNCEGAGSCTKSTYECASESCALNIGENGEDAAEDMTLAIENLENFEITCTLYDSYSLVSPRWVMLCLHALFWRP